MPRYGIVNRVTKERAIVEAPYAQDACERVGWMIGDCCVRLLREGPHTDITQAPVVIPAPRERGTP